MSRSCTICPRNCGCDRSGEKAAGFCRMGDLPKIARAGLHFWEEPVISGTNGSGTVFFSGCNLHCCYCQNYNISFDGEGKVVTVKRLQEIYQELIKQGAHNINLVTPSHYVRAIWQSLLTSPGVPVVYNTNSYDKVETLQTLSGKIQIYLADYKYADNALAMRYSQAADYAEIAWAAIMEMYRQTGAYQIDDNGIMQSGVIIRHLILPGCVENTLRIIDKVAKTFKPGEVLFSLMRQYLPCGKVLAGGYGELERKVSDAEYELIEEALFASGIEDGFVQDESSACEEFIPCFDGTGV